MMDAATSKQLEFPHALNVMSPRRKWLIRCPQGAKKRSEGVRKLVEGETEAS